MSDESAGFQERALFLEEQIRDVGYQLQLLADRGWDRVRVFSKPGHHEGLEPVAPSDHTPEGRRSARQPEEEEYSDRWMLDQAQTLYEERRLREKFFPVHFFAEPAWDILLDLLIHEIKGRRAPVTSVCLASSVPPTTALRWIGILEKEELIERKPAEYDRRVHWLSMTPKGASLVKRYIIALNSRAKSPNPELMLIRGREGRD